MTITRTLPSDPLLGLILLRLPATDNSFSRGLRRFVSSWVWRIPRDQRCYSWKSFWNLPCVMCHVLCLPTSGCDSSPGSQHQSHQERGQRKAMESPQRPWLSHTLLLSGHSSQWLMQMKGPLILEQCHIHLDGWNSPWRKRRTLHLADKMVSIFSSLLFILLSAFCSRLYI